MPEKAEKQRERSEQKKNAPARFRRNVDPRPHERERKGKSRDRGGRVSRTSAWAGTLLNIKPVMHVDDEGHLIPLEKVRGRKKSLKALVDHMEQTATSPVADQTVFISHGDCLEDAQLVAQLVKDRFGVKDVYMNYVGPVIGAHAGPGVLALFYVGVER